MPTTTIFCPICDALILDAPRCPACGKWERPPEPPAERGALAWRAALPAALDGSLTLADGALYACDAAGGLHALDAATGRPRWPQPVALGAWRIHRQVAVVGDLVIVGPRDAGTIPAGDKAVLALDAATGQERWRTPLAARQVSDPLVAGDAVYAATYDGQAVALALADGAVRWRAPLPGVSKAAPAAAGDQILFGGDKGLTALQAADGQVAWRFQAPAEGAWGNDLPYPAVCTDGVAYLTCWNGRCYALDAGTGEQHWASEPCKRPPMTPPLVTDDAVFFCAHDRYVYCLERASGARRWRTQLPARSQTTPVVLGGNIYVLSLDHKLYALDAASGALNGEPLLETARRVEGDWASDGLHAYAGDAGGQLYAVLLRARPQALDPEALAGQGQWPEAAARFALAGDLRRAAEIYAGPLVAARRAALLYERAGEEALAAAQFEAAGDLKAARRLYTDAGLHEEAARASLALGDLPAAGQALEAAGRMAEAADIYAQLALWSLAAPLYERAAQTADRDGDASRGREARLRAAEIYYLHLKQPDKAMQLYREAGAHDRIDHIFTHERDYNLWRAAASLVAPELAAAAYAERGHFVQAAEAYLRAGRPAEAAAMYRQQGEFAQARDAYLQAGQPGSAAAMLELAGNPGEAARLYEQTGELARAAALYAQANQPGRAASLLERIEDWPAAAGQWAAAERWEQAAHAWEQAGDFRQAAAAYVRIGACFMAAECLWRAGQAAQKSGDLSEATAALYQEAMTHYTDCGVYDRAQECDRLRRWLRKLPWLEVPLPQVEEFTPGEFGRIDIEVHNTGWGMARDITITISGQFEPDLTRADKPFPLQNHYASRRTIWVAPKRAGKQLPLHLKVTYLDAAGAPLPPLEISYDIVVRSKDERRSDSTPIIVQAGGKVIQMREGDFIEGDQVKIQRSGAGPASQGAPPGVAQTVMPAPNLACPACGTEQPADQPRCSNPACGMPFIRCINCGYYQPARTNFCMHCRAAQ